MVNSWLFLLGGDRFYFGDDIAEVIDRVGLTVSLVVVVVFVALLPSTVVASELVPQTPGLTEASDGRRARI